MPDKARAAKNLLVEVMTLVSTMFWGESFIYQNSGNFGILTDMQNKQRERNREGEINRELRNVI
jgi:hypothetical protein